ncbi:MAG: bifunctional oligoribonuclease/PAP phosphatase NrnA [Prevotella sp.]|uniref:DHH family phosphoesterase n=1 Tax=Prevotella sp. TaxID=59823 RepID=UPI002A276C42|nr:bifunctional oligoribonuclease/PAP phosphatase NrnA [Prevotella sp.]MDD7319309.1 bifunctional oligoribonuclease/PAP phosphatase NrnA [Prevotellaceae bacterium]MDY4020861.1 bifunctional oligoribonuclease/PAP phosphatase NrnA [Prevotella sp.]
MYIEILKNDEAATLKSLIEQSEKIVLCCHQNPDGDALGSCLGLAEYLKRLGKEPLIAIPDAFPDFLQWMPDAQTIVRFDKHRETVEEAMAGAELVFCLDFNRPERLGDEMCAVLKASPAKKVLIDHHLDPCLEAVLSISCPEMSSTSEMVFRAIWQLGGFEGMTKKGAVPIYCGMMTDTGGFTFNSSRPEIFFIISQLLTKGFDKDKVYRNVFHNYSDWRMRLMGYVLYQKMRVFHDCHAAYFTISRQDMKRFRFIKGDAEGLVNLPLQIKGVRLSISLREDREQDNLVWVSLRSVDEVTCNDIAERFFNGGGHRNASGGRLNCTLEEAEQIAVQAIKWNAERLQENKK